MTRDSVELAALVLHEIAHNTLYVKSATPFNESFAQLAGYRAAEAFFKAQGDTLSADKAAARWEDEVVLSGYYAELAARLDTLYRTVTDSTALDEGRKETAHWAREQLEGPIGQQLKTYRVGHLTERPVNNAQLIAARIYRTHLDLFERWYQLEGGDIARAVRDLKTRMDGVTGDSAFTVLEQAVDSTR
jgi:predicted aminopeptidase